MADVSIKYKGSEIATLDASGTKTLKTKATYCEDDITVEYTDTGTEKPTQEKAVTITENGTTEVLPDDGKALSKVTVTTNVPSGGGVITIQTTIKKADATRNITVNMSTISVNIDDGNLPKPTDLTGTKWKFKQTANWTQPESFSYFRIDGTFYEGENSLIALSSDKNIFTRGSVAIGETIKSPSFGYSSELNSPSYNVYPAPIVSDASSAFKWSVVTGYAVEIGLLVRDLNGTLTLSITGGNDVTNQALINWLWECATRIL